jgi:hypothetical protein
VSESRSSPDSERKGGSVRSKRKQGDALPDVVARDRKESEMREHEVPGLVELREKYNRKLEELGNYKELRSSLLNESLALIRKAVESQRLQVSEEALPAGEMRGSCGFCESCISDCVGCVCWS